MNKIKRMMAVARILGYEARVTPFGTMCMVQDRRNGKISAWAILDFKGNISQFNKAVHFIDENVRFSFPFRLFASMGLMSDWMEGLLITTIYNNIKEDVSNGIKETETNM